jgi:alanine racemase
MSGFALRSWVEISRRQIAANFRAIRDLVGPGVEVAPVVKADAYHHGAVEVARVLEGEGARWLAVASADEGAELRESGIASRILVMSDTLAGNCKVLAESRLTPVIHDLSALRNWDEVARRFGSPLPYHIKVDSGFGRLGTLSSAREAAAAVHEARHARLEGVMTHFASAADFDSRQTRNQMEAFRTYLRDLREAGIELQIVHMASSAPIAYAMQDAWGNMVRPGLSLYGYIPGARGAAPPVVLDVKPALSWRAAVLVVKEVPAGVPIGYNALFYAPRPMRIAVVAAGYADGVPHTLSNKGAFIAGGRRVPIIGAVSMDVTTVDVSNCPGLAPGDPVTIIGTEGEERQDAAGLAKDAGIIPYAILCGISSRVRRVYV